MKPGPMTADRGPETPKRWYRSYLYVPASEPARIEKALASPADAVVIDLEDSVPADRKDAARRNARSVLVQGPPKPVFVRVNGTRTGLSGLDVDAIAEPGLEGVRLPKAEDPEDIRSVLGLLRARGCPAPLIPIVESALGVERAFDLATADAGVAALAMGEADLGLDLGTGDDRALEFSRGRCLVASRAAGLPGAIQSVCVQLDDETLLRTTSSCGRAMGFSGRSAIHPRQLPVINEVYTPSDAEQQWARQVIDAHQRATASGQAVGRTAAGQFVDRPIAQRAAAILDLCRAAAT